MMKLLITFVVFAGIVYYFNLDIINIVEKSGAPKWLEEKGFVTRSTSSVASSTTASTAPIIIQINR